MINDSYHEHLIETMLNSYNSKLQILRELDSIIDFSKGGLQLRIMLLLGAKGYMSTRDISKALGERHKSIIDSIRKMVLKGLVEKIEDKGLYKLSETGLEFYNRLLSILYHDNRQRISREERREMSLDLAYEISRHIHLADALIALASSKRGELSINDIADAMRLSVDRAKTYLDTYSGESRLRLFKRIERRSRLLEIISKILKVFGIYIKTTLTVYRITDEGLTVFYKLPFYARYKRSIIAKILSKIFGTAHPRIVLKKTSLILLFSSLFTGFTTLLNPSESLIALLGSLTLATTISFVIYRTI